MIDEKYSELIIGWLDNELSPDQKKELDRLIEQGIINSTDLEEFGKMYSDMDKMPVPDPSETLPVNFYRWLANHTYVNHSSFKEFLSDIYSRFDRMRIRRMVYAFIILVIGFSAGLMYRVNTVRTQEIRNLNNEIVSMKSMMVLTLLEQSSSFDRLKAVNLSSGIDNKDEQVINALFKTLNNDPNVNVRLAALDALAKRGKNPEVRKMLVQSIDRQQSPIIQVAMADVMLSLDDKNSVPMFRRLLQKSDLNETVRQHIQHTIAKL